MSVVPFLAFLTTVFDQLALTLENVAVTLLAATCAVPFSFWFVDVYILDERHFVGPHPLKNES